MSIILAILCMSLVSCWPADKSGDERFVAKVKDGFLFVYESLCLRNFTNINSVAIKSSKRAFNRGIELDCRASFCTYISDVRRRDGKFRDRESSSSYYCFDGKGRSRWYLGTRTGGGLTKLLNVDNDEYKVMFAPVQLKDKVLRVGIKDQIVESSDGIGLALPDSYDFNFSDVRKDVLTKSSGEVKDSGFSYGFSEGYSSPSYYSFMPTLDFELVATDETDGERTLKDCLLNLDANFGTISIRYLPLGLNDDDPDNYTLIFEPNISSVDRSVMRLSFQLLFADILQFITLSERDMKDSNKIIFLGDIAMVNHNSEDLIGALIDNDNLPSLKEYIDDNREYSTQIYISRSESGILVHIVLIFEEPYFLYVKDDGSEVKTHKAIFTYPFKKIVK